MKYQKSFFLTQNYSTLFSYDKLTIVLSNFWKEHYLTVLIPFVTYSDIRRFFSIKSHHFFSIVFQNVNGRRLRYATVISSYRLNLTNTDASSVRSLMIQYFIWAIWSIQDFENLGRIFHFPEIEHRLQRLYWTFKCFGIWYGFNWRYNSSLKSTSFIETLHFQNSMLN